MNKPLLRVLALTTGTIGALVAQPSAPDITGTWQGTLSIPQANRELRVVVKITKDGNTLKGMFYSIDQGGQPIGMNGVTVLNSTLKFSVPGAGATYEGKLDSDGVNLTGTFSQGGGALPLNLKHVKDEQAWEIPKPPPPPKKMPADANPSFEVATIKPSRPGAPGKGLVMRDPRTFVTINYSAADLIVFAYGIHPRQITNAPAWLESDLYDIQATPDPPGLPNRQQIEIMVQKLLADRFKLAFHRDKKELSVFAITVAKTGLKLTPSTGDPKGLPGLGFQGLGRMFAQNANISDFAGLMQSTVLDRPVVDQTGLEGRFDFQLKWTPDDSQFPGLKGQLPPPPEGADAPPDLFTALQQQLGLKMEATRAQIGVIVIDHVEKPSAN
ncbi:MAG TPA: TIGR03435 family protein [Bryobacteraceae bacterium]|nr:TIGR03435 family protein [Bryobacteraceae bacterium]